MIFIQCIIIIFIFNFFWKLECPLGYYDIVLKPAAVHSMENTVRVNSTATTDCVIINWVVRNKMVCFVRVSVCNYLKLCKVLICNHFHFFFFEDTVKSLSQTSYGTSVRNTTTKLVVTKFPKDLSFLQVLHSSML